MTFKALAKNDEKFEKTIEQLDSSGDLISKLKLLLARINYVALENQGLTPDYNKRYNCGTCGSNNSAENPNTGFCFYCDTDNWKLKE